MANIPVFRDMHPHGAEESIVPSSLDGYRVFSSSADFYEAIDGKPQLVCQYRRCVPEIAAQHNAVLPWVLKTAEVFLPALCAPRVCTHPFADF